MIPPPEPLAPWLVSIKKALGWSPMKMSSFLGVSTRALWTWEKGRNPPPYAVILIYQQLDYLLGYREKLEKELGDLPLFLERWGLVGLWYRLLTLKRGEGS